MANILSMDTSGSRCAVCLDRNGNLFCLEQDEDRSQARTLLALVRQLFLDGACTLGELDALAVVSGPGSFTGLRIGTGVVQGLALAGDLPVVTLSSLAVLAQSGFADSGCPVQLVAIKSQNREIFFAAYRVAPDGVVRLTGEEMVLTAWDCQSGSNGTDAKDILAIGDGWESLANLADVIGLLPTQIITRVHPRIDAMATLARHGYNSGALVKAERVLPNYLKDELDYRRAE